MSPSDDLWRHFDIADGLLEQGFLLYFTGLSPGQLQARIAEVDNDYRRIELGDTFVGDSRVGATSAAAQYVEEYLIPKVGPPEPGYECRRLRQLLAKLAESRLKMEWWDATWPPHSFRMWSPPDRSWVGLACPVRHR